MGATQIRGTQILDNDITFDDIGDGAVRGATANGGTQRELATGTVSDVDIRNSAITPLKIDSTQGFSMASLSLTNTSNQMVLGTTTTVTLTAPTPTANRIMTIPDVGGSASFFMTEGTQTANGSKTFTSRVTLAVAGHNNIHWDFDRYTLDNNDQYGMFLSGSDVQLRAAANATIDVSASVATIQPFSSPSWLFNSGGLSSTTGLFYPAAGTVGAPSHSFNGDSDTGMYDVAANTIGFATNGTEAMRIDSAQNVGIGGSPVTNGLLTLSSTTKAFVPPRMTQTQRDAIASPSAGMVVYNTDTNLLNVYNGSTWIPVGSTTFPLLAPNGSVSAPSYSWSSETNSGWYRIGANDFGFSINGVKSYEFTGGAFSTTASQVNIGTTSGPIGTVILQPLTSAVAGTLQFTTTISQGGDGFWSFRNQSGSSTSWIRSVDGAFGIATPPAQLAGALTITGNATFYGATPLVFVPAGFTGTTISIAATNPSANRIYTVPDVGADASFVLTQGAQTIAGIKTFSSQTLHSSGTAALPGISFSSDTHTGVYLPAANSLALSTNSTEAVLIDSSQNVDFLQHQAKQLVVHVLSSDPGSPVEGQIWYNTTTHQWVGYNGTSNVVLG